MKSARLRRLAVGVCVVVVAALAGPGAGAARAAASGTAVGTLAGSVVFSQECGGSDIGVGITYDGANLWYSCYDTPTDLYRADPRTGQVSASYSIQGGLGALAYDATRNAIWAGWAGPNQGAVQLIQLDGQRNVTGSRLAFTTCSSTCSNGIDDGLAYDGGSDSLYFKPDSSTVIYHYSSKGVLLADGPGGSTVTPWAGGGNCYNSGLAIGDQYLFQGADGCSHVYVVDKTNPQNVLYDFSTATPGDPNFRDEGLACDPNTFSGTGQQVMWSKEAYGPMRAHAFTIPDNSCGVGGLPVGVGPPIPAGFHGPLPLIAAHGITGQPQDVLGLLRYGKNTVPGLNDSSNGGRVATANTGPISSVWDNGAQIAKDVDSMIARTGAPAVNVIAHSKGGLDAREAISIDPAAVASLGMLATPNAGSKLADKLCVLRRLGITGVFSSQGACDNDSDGLYDLQSGYVTKVFNQVVRDDPSTAYYVAAGNCSTKSTDYLCNATANLGLDCQLRGGDTVVCVDSAFALAPNYSNYSGSGLQDALPPVFQGYDHSAMKDKACPVTRVLAELYPYDSQGNTWIDGDGTGCESSGAAPAAAAPAGGGAQAFAQPASSSTTSTATASPTAADPTTATAEQAVTTGSYTASGPAYSTVLDPEGGNSVAAYVFTNPGINPTIAVLDSRGNPDSSAVVTPLTGENSLGATVSAVAIDGLNGSTRTLRVTAPSNTAVIVDSLVQPAGKTLTATLSSTGAPAGGAAPFTIQAALNGVAPGQAKKETLVAAYLDSSNTRRTVALVYNQASGTFTANLTLPAGQYTPVDVTATGPLARITTTDEFVPDGTGTLAQVTGAALVRGPSGALDTLRLPVPVTVATPGTYQVSVDLRAGAALAASGQGSAALPAGASTVTVDVPVSRLYASGAEGPLRITNALLTRGTSGRTEVARAADLGSTDAYHLATLSNSKPLLSRFTGSGQDTNGDGTLDTLTYSGQAYAPTSGQYVLTGQLYGPTGQPLQHVQQTQLLQAGSQPLSVHLDGTLVGLNGSGTYRLSGLTLTLLSDQSQQAHTADALAGPFQATNWIGTSADTRSLQQLWDTTDQAGHIHQRGLYVNEHNRLSRVTAAGNTDTGTAKREIDTFITDIANEHAADEPYRDQVVAYARRAPSTFGP